MKLGETLYVSDRKQWRLWLLKNHEKEKEIWLIYFRKETGKPRILYNDAVEEALCFGWIDSTIKSIDREKTAQRFSPRNSKSKYSQPNKERLKWLMKEDKIHSSIKDNINKIIKEKYIFSPDILKAIKSDKQAWENYQKFSSLYRRIRVAYIDVARKRPAEFNKRLANFIEKTKQNKQIGFGGIEKYY